MTNITIYGNTTYKNYLHHLAKLSYHTVFMVKYAKEIYNKFKMKLLAYKSKYICI